MCAHTPTVMVGASSACSPPYWFHGLQPVSKILRSAKRLPICCMRTCHGRSIACVGHLRLTTYSKAASNTSITPPVTAATSKRIATSSRWDHAGWLINHDSVAALMRDCLTEPTAPAGPPKSFDRRHFTSITASVDKFAATRSSSPKRQRQLRSRTTNPCFSYCNATRRSASMPCR